MVQGVAAITGNPEISGFASLLLTTFSAVPNGQAPPKLTIEAGLLDGKISSMYNAPLNAANDTHEALVGDWSRLQAFAAPTGGLAPSDDDLKQAGRAGELDMPNGLSNRLHLWCGEE